MLENCKYVISPEGFKGNAYDYLMDGVGVIGTTAAEYEENGYTIVDEEEFDRLVKEWEKSLTGDWKEITAEQYEYAIEVLPPLKWFDGGFFGMEAFSGSLHSFYQEINGRYFSSLQSIRTPRGEILGGLKKWIEQQNGVSA